MNKKQEKRNCDKYALGSSTETQYPYPVVIGLHGRVYKVLEKIGSGSYGTVFKCEKL